MEMEETAVNEKAGSADEVIVESKDDRSTSREEQLQQHETLNQSSLPKAQTVQGGDDACRSVTQDCNNGEEKKDSGEGNHEKSKTASYSRREKLYHEEEAETVESTDDDGDENVPRAREGETQNVMRMQDSTRHDANEDDLLTSSLINNHVQEPEQVTTVDEASETELPSSKAIARVDHGQGQSLLHKKTTVLNGNPVSTQEEVQSDTHILQRDEAAKLKENVKDANNESHDVQERIGNDKEVGQDITSSQDSNHDNGRTYEFFSISSPKEAHAHLQSAPRKDELHSTEDASGEQWKGLHTSTTRDSNQEESAISDGNSRAMQDQRTQSALQDATATAAAALDGDSKSKQDDTQSALQVNDARDDNPVSTQEEREADTQAPAALQDDAAALDGNSKSTPKETQANMQSALQDCDALDGNSTSTQEEPKADTQVALPDGAALDGDSTSKQEERNKGDTQPALQDCDARDGTSTSTQEEREVDAQAPAARQDGAALDGNSKSKQEENNADTQEPEALHDGGAALDGNSEFTREEHQEEEEAALRDGATDEESPLQISRAIQGRPSLATIQEGDDDDDASKALDLSLLGDDADYETSEHDDDSLSEYVSDISEDESFFSEQLQYPPPVPRRTSSVIAVGLPSEEIEANAGIPIPIAPTPTPQDGQAAPPRFLSPMEAEQEAISEQVASLVAQQEHNEKHGIVKKEAATSTNMMRRESSSVTVQKTADGVIYSTNSTNDMAALLRERSSIIIEKTADGVHISTQENATNLNTTTIAKDGSIRISVATLSDQLTTSDTLEAQAGIPVVMPGAYAMEGVGIDRAETGYDSGFDGEDAGPTVEEVDDEETNTIELQQAESGVLPAELHPHDRQQSEALLVEPIDDEEQPKPFKRRLYIGMAVVGVLAILAAIVTAVLVTRGGDSSSAPPPPSPSGWDRIGDAILGPTNDDNGEFGHAIALSGDANRIIVGLPGWDDGTSRLRVGRAHVLELINSTRWILSQILQGPGVGAEAGSSVAISKSGNVVAVGSPRWDNRGHVGVYQLSEQGDQELLGDENANGQFGGSVSLSSDGKILVVGSAFSDGSAGQGSGIVKVYQIDSSTWTQLGNDIEGEAPNELFGWSVALSDDGMSFAAGAVGGSTSSSSVNGGAVRVYRFVDGQWNQRGSTLFGQNRFGHSVSIANNGTIVAVGVNGQGADPGSAQIYSYNSDDDEWTQMGQTLEGQAAFDKFGYSVDLAVNDNNNVVSLAVGSPDSDAGGADKGGLVQIYEYDTNSQSWIQRLGDIVGNQEGENFGWSVSLGDNGNVVGCGAPKRDFDGRVFNVGMVSVYKASGS